MHKAPYVIYPLAALAIVIAMYWAGLHGGFFFDDSPNILEVGGIRLSSLSMTALASALASGTTGALGRPISQLSFALNYFLSGYDPFYFKLTNLAIHCLNVVLVFFVSLHLVTAFLVEKRSKAAYCLASIIAFSWAIHPIQLTSVLYVVQRMTSLSALFLLGALLLHVHVRQSESLGRRESAFLLIIAWVVLWPLSVLSKESGVLFFGYVAAYELTIRRAHHRGLDTFGRVVFFSTFAAIAVLAALFFTPLFKFYLSGYSHRSFSLPERLLTEARVIWEYIGLITIPRQEAFGLFHDDIVISSGLLEPPTTFLAIFGLAGLAYSAWLLRLRAPLISFGIAWFFVGHSLESTFLPLEIAHEHRNYLPLLGICLLPIGPLTSLAKCSGITRTVSVTLCCAFVAYLGLLTFLRSSMFGNDGLRTQIETQHHPRSARSNYEAGRFLTDIAGNDRSNTIALSLARKHYELATSSDADFKLGLLGQIRIDCLMSDQRNEEVIAELARRLEKTIFAPGDATLMFHLQEMTRTGKLCLRRSDVDGLFVAALANSRVSPDVRMLLHSWHADYLWLHEHDLTAALNAIERALQISPRNPSNLLKLAQLLYISGDSSHARVVLTELQGKQLQPEERDTLNNLLSSLDENYLQKDQ